MLANNQLDLAGKEIAKKLVQRCLHIVDQDSPKAVASRSEWVRLFDASHSLEEFEALLVNGELDENPQMSVVDMSKDAGRSLPGSGQSARLRRCLEDYAAHLRRLFAVTKELVFIDPYLSCKGNYRDFPHLLAAIPARSEAPRIKLHRQAKPNHKENCLWKHEWEEHFAPLDEVLRQKDLKAEVFI